ncbi:MAG TPA: glycosyltransferase family 9 protein [Xanthobacteraceae bacterium]|jgi:ADP-heptose:LPS heptosyltransferase|nr:glycosyltransferase family 9 protein [Xanthobacteraceae bacterium]
MLRFFRPLFNPKPDDAKLQQWSGVHNLARQIGQSPKILILKLDHIGDFVISFEAFLKIRSAWPSGHITLVCSPGNIELAKSIGIFDQIIAFEFFPSSNLVSRSSNLNINLKIEQFKKLELGSFDVAIDMRHDGDTRPLLLTVKALCRAGYASHLLKEPLDISLPEIENSARQAGGFKPLHAQTRLTLLAELVIMTLTEWRNPFLNKLVPRGGNDFTSVSRYIVFSLSAGAPIRRWPNYKVKELCARIISATDYTLLLVGGPDEAIDVDEIIDTLPPNRCVNLVGHLSILELAPVLAKAALFIGYDTGITHLAAQLNTPTLAIYAAVSDPTVWTPRGEKVAVLRVTGLPCSPCYLRKANECKFKVKCLSLISVDAVFDLAIKILSDSSAQ